MISFLGEVGVNIVVSEDLVDLGLPLESSLIVTNPDSPSFLGARIIIELDLFNAFRRRAEAPSFVNIGRSFEPECIVSLFFSMINKRIAIL